MGMKLLQINRQRVERSFRTAFALSIISCRGKEIYSVDCKSTLTSPVY